MTNFIIAQILSIINGIFLITSIRSKEKKKFLVQNSISNLAGFLSMIVLGAYSASIGPVILTIQGIITYIYEEKKKKKQPKWLLIMYPLLSLIAWSLTITSILSILPIISSTLASTMLITKNMKTSRKINLVSSVLALPYLITNKAYVAAIIFSASFINTLEAIYKIDYKKANNNTKTTNTENQEKEIANNKAMVPSQNITHNKNISKPKTKKLILKKKEWPKSFFYSVNILASLVTLPAPKVRIKSSLLTYSLKYNLISS